MPHKSKDYEVYRIRGEGYILLVTVLFNLSLSSSKVSFDANLDNESVDARWMILVQKHTVEQSQANFFLASNEPKTIKYDSRIDSGTTNNPGEINYI